MELELGLAPPNAHLRINRLDDLSCSSGSSSGSGKRSFQETLPLFDDGSSKQKKQLVGWPPVSSARSRACGGANSYVKVKKEGEAIGRKVDLSVHASYDELIATLARMFPATNNQSGTACYSSGNSGMFTNKK